MGSVSDEQEAVQIALLDAKERFVDLDKYRIHVSLSDDIWMVDLEPRDASQLGGASYLISKHTGEILNKR
jgi:hypothetical protein